MAHELHFTDGVADCFVVAQTAWHNEGHVLVNAPSYAEALRLAHLDYEVKKERTYRRIGESEYAPNDLSYIVTRTDTGMELGSVGPDYTVVQNRDAFKVLRPLLDEGLATLETGGVLRNGADAWLMVRWDFSKFGPVVREVFNGEVLPYGLLACNHSGRRGILLADTPVRVVCANTLGFAEADGVGRKVAVRHTGDAEARLVDAAHALWGNVIERYETLAQQYRVLKGAFLDEAMFRELVVKAAVDDPRQNPKFNPDAKLAEMVVARYEKKVQAITTLWTGGKGHSGDHSAWEAYQGLVEAVDHRPDLFPVRAGTYRTASLLDGRLAQIKRTVLTNLLGLAA